MSLAEATPIKPAKFRNVWYTGEIRWHVFCFATLVRCAGTAFFGLDEFECNYDIAQKSAVIATKIIEHAAKDLLSGSALPSGMAAAFALKHGNLTSEWRISRADIRDFVTSAVVSA